MKQLEVFFVDNFDSFSFNLVDEFERRGCRVWVWRNDLDAQRAFDLAQSLQAPRLIVLSPGPGHPRDAGCCVELIKLARGKIPVLGICLGHQALIEALGGTVGSAGEIVHGKASRIQHTSEGLFAGLPSPLAVGRYHSLSATRVPAGLDVRATSGEVVMAVESATEKLAGLQFHPESILTPEGGLLLDRVIAWASEAEAK